MLQVKKQPDLVIKRIRDDGTEETLIIEVKSIEKLIEEKVKKFFESSRDKTLKLQESAERYRTNMEEHNILGNVWKKENFNPDAKYRIETCLKDIIKRRGILQSKLAEMIGINESTLSDIVNNKGANPGLITILKICAVLDIPVEGTFWLVIDEE
jgi:DNA-binding XRE family transcriptional regulator